jgi:probable phosphoglycerate mutase
MKQVAKKKTRLCVMRTGQTTFQAESRIESLAGSSLTDKGIEDSLAAAREMSAQKIGAVYGSRGQGEVQTVELVARELGAKARGAPDLRGPDFGLWQGLTTCELKRRQPTAYRLWKDAPQTVRPPGGETLIEVRRRLGGAIDAILRKHRNGSALVVLPPMALELVLCMLSDDDDDTIWRPADPSFTWSSYEMNGRTV